MKGISITAVSDLHGHYPQLEGGDLLIVAGDLTARDTKDEYLIFGDWIQKQNYRAKIVISGNHDGQIERILNECKLPDDLGLPKQNLNPFKLFGVEYLCDSGTEFEYMEVIRPEIGEANPMALILKHSTLKIWGSPWTLRFPGENPRCLAFTCETEEELAEHWKCIPEDTDILVTHSPAYGVLDTVHREVFCGERDENVGSESLIKPLVHSDCRLHICGHIHEGYGEYTNPISGIKYVNASHVNERYEPVNKPIRIEL